MRCDRAEACAVQRNGVASGDPIRPYGGCGPSRCRPIVVARASGVVPAHRLVPSRHVAHLRVLVDRRRAAGTDPRSPRSRCLDDEGHVGRVGWHGRRLDRLPPPRRPGRDRRPAASFSRRVPTASPRCLRSHRHHIRRSGRWRQRRRRLDQRRVRHVGARAGWGAVRPTARGFGIGSVDAGIDAVREHRPHSARASAPRGLPDAPDGSLALPESAHVSMHRHVGVRIARPRARSSFGEPPGAANAVSCRRRRGDHREGGT